MDEIKKLAFHQVTKVIVRSYGQSQGIQNSNLTGDLRLVSSVHLTKKSRKRVESSES